MSALNYTYGIVSPDCVLVSMVKTVVARFEYHDLNVLYGGPAPFTTSVLPVALRAS